MKRVAILGAGVAGLTLTLMLQRAGFRPELFEASATGEAAGASPVAAGMLAPWAELETGHPEDLALGRESLSLWPGIAALLDDPGCFVQSGSLILAHPRDREELLRLARRIAAAGQANRAMAVDGERIAMLEPALHGRFRDGLSLPAEGHVDPERLLPALRRWLAEREVPLHAGSPVSPVSTGGEVERDGMRHAFDLVIDCRGLGARDVTRGLRGVRGEVAILRTREVRLNRPVRIMHPRWPIYIVPRHNGRFLVGASEVESEDPGPVHARSALELLSAAYAVDPAFGEASVEAFRTGLRPAYSDNRPRLTARNRLVSVNGLFRHGYLFAPALARRVVEFARTGELPGGPFVDSNNAALEETG